ncbi:hypothetical protein EVAR_85412_1 [Eumeta japonica]|uniref:Uncharacterized protein n=1 Tax=Eumeta variegata TaxID=151549 RepID=A0A4C1WIZ5_EUMVA|nr:hypothetical protein EVAR_85412_1 [Eumeta japonica]
MESNGEKCEISFTRSVRVNGSQRLQRDRNGFPCPNRASVEARAAPPHYVRRNRPARTAPEHGKPIRQPPALSPFALRRPPPLVPIHPTLSLPLLR